ncbi:methylated-DNA--[protein]-cysteine S-methyltransferase [Peloplasma aerotolerans]|uniref:Methylated-DNA--protein-cysteine methyltransferase n=1 Tax=Peloplasma aerotolerans TaxID=3044389 RepID=A0AAW6U8R6_9MOLU|nr:methylated-DNA--[protein]-cysteine S-methyltransferase [Mariniplasma sp. M4Ah]MDI6452441.1 methylated-DNA--[protein]-cysteine S-methyltransferase [Mariniplasma sp. M4Ah]
MLGKYKSKYGMIYYLVQDDKLRELMIQDLKMETDENMLINEVKNQLNLYFNHQLRKFDLPIGFNRGTDFQKDVWQALLTIPYGETRSYQDIANLIGKPKAVRAVGQACKKNPIGIIVPCHRVIGKDGSMTGYSGKEHTDLKQKLINHEKILD